MLGVRERDLPTSKTNSLASASEAGFDRVSEMRQTSAPSNERETARGTLSIGAQTRADLRNPYGRFTAILNPQEFAGRSQVVQSIYAAIANNQLVSLVGPRCIGKSSVLQYLCTGEAKQRFGYKDALHLHIFVFKDLREFLQGSGEDFFQMLSAEIIAQSKDHLTLATPKEKGTEGFRALLDLIRASGFHLVLLLDEFDKIPQFDLTFFEFLRAQADLGKVSYVVASRNPLHQFFPGSPLLDFFEIFGFYQLGPLTTNEAQTLITVPAQRAHLPFTEDEVAWTLEMAGCHPFLIQRTCYCLFEEKLRQENTKIDLKHMQAFVYHEIFPYFAKMCDDLDEEQQKLLKQEVIAHKKDTRHIPELSNSLLFQRYLSERFNSDKLEITAKDVRDALDNLEDRDMLARSKLSETYYIIKRYQQENTPSLQKKGMLVYDFMKIAFERLRAGGVRSDAAFEWRIYNILYYRYFRYHPLIPTN
jgi:hypothetical protein